MQPLVSVIIVNWNGKKWLQKCLDSLLSQTYQNLEIIIVDNASTDKSVDYIQENYPQVRLIVSEKNGWFAYGNNLWIKDAKGELILLLNNDTWLDNDLIEKLYHSYIATNADAIAPQEAKYDTTLMDPVLWIIDPFWHGVKIPYSAQKSPFYLQWLCLLFSKKLYIETGWLDENFFMYFEETDWFWRLNLYGKKIIQSPDLYIYHAWAASTEWGGIKYNNFLWRNQNTLQMLLKNYAWYTLLWTLPIYLLQNLGEMLAFTIIGKPKIAYSYIEWWMYNIKNLRRMWEQSTIIQQKRKINDTMILSRMYHGFWKVKHLLQFITK